MLDFILNTFFVKKEVQEKPLKKTYIRKEVGERKEPTSRERFVSFNNRSNDVTELSKYFVSANGLYRRSAENYRRFRCRNV